MKRTTIALAALVTAALGAGGSAALLRGDDHGPFRAGASPEPVTCMEHQPHAPDPAATGGTARNLTVLRYHTANGLRPYCDGGPPTRNDRAWADLHVTLGGDAASVAAIRR
ncbi:hypothetical protein [Actinomadura flavalba]|uniref:hypothetical protein n=1 Tax=Actinomadura flavalba TaxID=1120938 RepID=UPI000375841A|nr:hypothetical protein [Actinomadura flavalba]